MSKIDVSWKRENRQLDSDAENNVQLKKQINKQTDMDSLIQNSINDKIYDLKQEALLLTKKAENQKYKYTIIKTIKIRMGEERKTEASSVTESNFETIEGYERRIKKYEYDLEQINSKANKINSIVSQKKHKISLLRTDRVIDSSIFRNIEKELISTEMEFKKLLIQKIRHQKVYQDCLNEYNLLKQKAQQYFQNQQAQQKSQLTSQENPDQQSYILEGTFNINDKNKFKEIERNPALRNTVVQADLRRQEQSYYHEFKVKKFLMNLNLNTGKQFLYNWHNIQMINDNYFNTLNSTGDQINHYEEEIKKIQKTIHENTIQFYKPKNDPTKSQLEAIKCQKIKNEIQKVHESAQQEVQTLNTFMGAQNFTEFAKFVDFSGDATKDIDLETLTQLLKSIEAKMSQLNFYQAPKLIEESGVVIKTSRTEKQKREEKLEDVMNRVKICEESDKIMKKEEFKEEYRKMMEATSTAGSRQVLKKRTKKAN